MIKEKSPRITYGEAVKSVIYDFEALRIMFVGHLRFLLYEWPQLQAMGILTEYFGLP
jgi:hypothetical protein